MSGCVSSKSSESEPVLSVVIPTRNRKQCALSCVRHLVAIDDPGLEIVVFDNSDDRSLQELLDPLMGDKRIKYTYFKERIDVVHCFNLATAQAMGNYVCHIGDDDGVSPEIVKIARIAQREGWDAVIPERPAIYFWPKHQFYYYGQAFAATLFVPAYSGKWRVADCRLALTRCLRDGGQRFFDLPRSYHGIVHRSALTEIYTRTGTYFPGPSPDLAGAVALSLVVKQCVILDYPFIVAGTSATSAGGLGSAKRHIGRLEDWPHLPRRSVERWSKFVPRFFSGRTIWAEDVVQALDAFGEEALLRKFDRGALYGVCLAAHAGNAQDVFTALSFTIRHSSTLERMFVFRSLVLSCAKYMWWRVVNFARMLRRLLPNKYTITSVYNMEQVSSALANASAKRGGAFASEESAREVGLSAAPGREREPVRKTDGGHGA